MTRLYLLIAAAAQRCHRSLCGQADHLPAAPGIVQLLNKQAGESQSGITFLSSTHPHRDFSCCEVPAWPR